MREAVLWGVLGGRLRRVARPVSAAARVGVREMPGQRLVAGAGGLRGLAPGSRPAGSR